MKLCTNLGRRQRSEKRSGLKTRAVHECLNGKVQILHDRKKGRQIRSKVKRTLIICFNFKVIVLNEFVLEDQIVGSVYYCDISQ
jgi:hypothetical protein